MAERPNPASAPAEVSRLRIVFRRGDEVKYISHLDLMRAWVRIFRRAGLPIAYSQGFSPHPQLSFAAPLAVGVIGEEEPFDVTFVGKVLASDVQRQVAEQLPAGIRLLDVWPISVTAPPLTRLIVGADFAVLIETSHSAESIVAAIDRFFASETVPWERTREGKSKRYDLRPLVEELRLLATVDGRAELTMRLVADNTRAGRPEEVVEALGIGDPYPQIRRLRLVFREPIR